MLYFSYHDTFPYQVHYIIIHLLQAAKSLKLRYIGQGFFPFCQIMVGTKSMGYIHQKSLKQRYIGCTLLSEQTLGHGIRLYIIHSGILDNMDVIKVYHSWVLKDIILLYLLHIKSLMPYQSQSLIIVPKFPGSLMASNATIKVCLSIAFGFGI